jgi:thiosulfate/3-mercaptopyruvate sulfurtransferase
MNPLITVAELRVALDGPEPPVLLDSRWRLGGPPGIDSYRAGHLPGARYVDLDRDLADPPGVRGRHPLPDPEVFGAAMRAAGVRDDLGVVVYDDGDGIPAARAWWLLRWCAHRNVRMLDGGYRAWTQAGAPTTQDEPPRPEAGDFTPSPGAMPILDAAEAGSLPGNGGVLLDVRTPERYRGEVEPIDPVAGHIPGALNSPPGTTVTPAGQLQSPAALSEHYAALGIGPGTQVGAYCGSGVTAAREVLALAVAGIPAALYPGSWSEWLADPTRPITTG